MPRVALSRAGAWPPEWTRPALFSAALVVLAAALRVGNLGPESLWVDDAWVAYANRAAYRELPSIGLTAIGYVIALKAWFGVVGFSEVTAQLPAMFAGILTPALLFLVLRRRVGGLGAAGVAVILATNDTHITYSYHVKQYTFDALWAVACLGFCFGLASEGIRLRRHLLFFVVATLAGVVSFTTVVATFGVIIATSVLIVRAVHEERRPGMLLAPQRDHLTAIAVMAAAGAFLVAFQRVVLSPNITDGIQAYWREQYVDRSSLSSALASIADKYADVAAVTFGISPDTWLAYAAAGLVVVCLLVGVCRLDPPGVFCATAAGVAGALSFAGLAPLGGGRTDLHLLVPLLAGTAIGLQAIAQHFHLDQRLGVRTIRTLIVVGVAMFVVFNPPAGRAYPDNTAREFVSIIDEERDPDDAILLHRSHFAYGLYTARESTPVSDNYHFTPRYPDDPLVFRLRWGIDEVDAHRQRLTQVSEQTDVMWLLSSPIGQESDLDVFATILDGELGFELTDRHVGRNTVLQRWERNTP